MNEKPLQWVMMSLSVCGFVCAFVRLCVGLYDWAVLYLMQLIVRQWKANNNMKGRYSLHYLGKTRRIERGEGATQNIKTSPLRVTGEKK